MIDHGATMGRTRRVKVAIAAVAALATWTTLIVLSDASVLAHHSPVGIYRTDVQTTVDGVLVSIVYRRPHSYLYVEARSPGPSNEMRVWAVECDTDPRVRARVTEGILRPGDRIIVTGEPARDDGAWRVRLRRLVRPSDGWGWQEGGP